MSERKAEYSGFRHPEHEDVIYLSNPETKKFCERKAKDSLPKIGDSQKQPKQPKNIRNIGKQGLRPHIIRDDGIGELLSFGILPDEEDDTEPDIETQPRYDTDR